MLLRGEAGAIGGKFACPRAGTTVEAADLFFNTPARLKFMKSAASELSAGLKIVARSPSPTPACRCASPTTASPS